MSIFDVFFKKTETWDISKYVITLLRHTPCAEGCEYCNPAFDLHHNLKLLFGYDSFRTYNGEPLQEQAAQAAVTGKSLLAIFPTGGGKSLTFQLPALMSARSVHGLTVVISPLQSLMKDQVERRGIPTLHRPGDVAVEDHRAHLGQPAHHTLRHRRGTLLLGMGTGLPCGLPLHRKVCQGIPGEEVWQTRSLQEPNSRILLHRHRQAKGGARHLRLFQTLVGRRPGTLRYLSLAHQSPLLRYPCGYRRREVQQAPFARKDHRRAHHRLCFPNQAHP